MNNSLTFIDIFAGAGGLAEGFIETGFSPIAHIEMNKYAALTLKTRACYHFLKSKGDSKKYFKYLSNEISRQDLYESVPKEIVDIILNEEINDETINSIFCSIDEIMTMKNIGNVDIIIGGPPCQAYSLVGRAVDTNKMMGDHRNYLYLQYMKFLKRFKPKMFVFENVPGLLTANGGDTMRDILSSFKAAGYKVDYRLIDAQNFGVLQQRKRIIIVGWLKRMNLVYPDFEFSNSCGIVNDILRDLEKIKPGGRSCSYVEPPNAYLISSGIRDDKDILTDHICRSHNENDQQIYKKVIEAWDTKGIRLKYTDIPDALATHHNRHSFLDRYKVLAANKPFGQTMIAHISKDGHYFIHPDSAQCRSISVREAARLQSFPDNFFFEGPRTAKFVQIGNAVPPLMAKGISKAIKNMLMEG